MMYYVAASGGALLGFLIGARLARQSGWDEGWVHGLKVGRAMVEAEEPANNSVDSLPEGTPDHLKP